MDEIRRKLSEGRIALPTVGRVARGESASLPWLLLGSGDSEVEPVSAFLRDLMLSDMSMLTARSYAADLLRWWRVLAAVVVPWDRATRSEVELMVGWMRSAPNRQRMLTTTAGLLNIRTGKPAMRSGYAPATINHALSVVSSFYAFHGRFGGGPVTNPVPANPARRASLAHRSPLEQLAEHDRAPLRQRASGVSPRSITDGLWDELMTAMTCHRDRAIVTVMVSSAVRASELLGLQGQHVDWGRQQMWVVSKGSRVLQPVPASPEAFEHLRRYYAERGTPAPDQPVWRTIKPAGRPLTYWALRRVLQRANTVMGTNWSLHDFRHTAIDRMTADPTLTLPEVMAVTRHRRLASLAPYLRPRVEQMADKMLEHYTRPRPDLIATTGYDPDDFQTVFGA